MASRKEPKRVRARFYLSPGGANPVRDWLMDLPAEDRRQVGQDISDVECGWPIGMSVCKAFGVGLWRVAARCPAGESRGCCSACAVVSWSCCTASSRRRKRPRRVTWTWRPGEQRKSNHEPDEKPSGRPAL